MIPNEPMMDHLSNDFVPIHAKNVPGKETAWSVSDDVISQSFAAPAQAGAHYTRTTVGDLKKPGRG